MPAVTASTVRQILLVAAICALPIVFYAPFFTEPFFRDEGLYAAVAQWMLDGHLPYENAFDNKPPMIFVYYATSFVLFGENIWAPRLLVSLLLSGATALMYVEGRLLYSHRGGLVAATAFACSFGLATLETNANTEFFMIPSMVAALVTFTIGRKTGKPGWYLASGFLSGVAIATKHISLFPFVLFLLLAAWSAFRARGVRAPVSREFWGSAGALLAGCAVAGITVVAPFAATGGLDDMYEQTVVYSVKYVGNVPLESKLDVLRQAPLYLTLLAGPWLLFGLLAVAQVIRRGAQGSGVLVFGWLAANVVGIIMAGRFYDHYYMTLLPGLSLVAPLGARLIRDLWARPATKIVVFGFIPLVAITPAWQNAAIYFQPSAEERHLSKYDEDTRAPWENQGEEFGAWIQARTDSDDFVYNFGFQSELYFYSDRRSPTRFLMDRPFWYSDKYVEQALVELNADPPLYVIDSAIHEDWSALKLYTPEIKAWIEGNYDFVGKVYYADVWVLKGSPDDNG